MSIGSVKRVQRYEKLIYQIRATIRDGYLSPGDCFFSSKAYNRGGCTKLGKIIRNMKGMFFAKEEPVMAGADFHIVLQVVKKNVLNGGERFGHD